MDRAAVMLGALVYAGIGLWALVDPVGMLALAGVTAAGPDGAVELRAMYGGLQLGMAAFLTWCAFGDHVRIGLIAAGLTIGGLGATRAVALLATGGVEIGLMHGFVVAELTGAALYLLLLRRHR